MTEWIVTSEFQFLTCLPPTVHRGDYAGMQRVTELCLQFNFAGFGFEKDPIAITDSLRPGGTRVNFQERVRNGATQSRNIAMLFVAKVNVSEKCQGERVFIDGVTIAR